VYQRFSEQADTFYFLLILQDSQNGIFLLQAGVFLLAPKDLLQGILFSLSGESAYTLFLRCFLFDAWNP
jgi:hypothetical protein